MSEKPIGWSDADLQTVQEHGYFIAGVNNLNPSSAYYNVAGLLQNKDQLTPYILDPSLEELYDTGNAEAVGFYPKAKLITKREKAIQKQKAQVKKGAKASQQSGRVESKKKAQRDPSTSLTASTSFLQE